MRCIRLEDKRYIEQIRKDCGHVLSSHAFASLFVWQKNMKLSIDLSEDGFLVQTQEQDNSSFFFPCGSQEAKLHYVRRVMEKPGASFLYMREEDKDFLEKFFPGEFSYQEIPESEEYIYERSGFETLSGSAYSNVRKQVKRLLREHRVEALPFQEKDAEQIKALIDHYNVQMHQTGYRGLRDDDISERVFRYRSELGCYGVTVWVDGAIKATAFGFPLNEDTIDGCMECHDKEIDGLSCYTQMSMLLAAPGNYQYLNGEEDLGIPGLRSMKRHLNPCRMNRIYTAIHKG